MLVSCVPQWCVVNYGLGSESVVLKAAFLPILDFLERLLGARGTFVEPRGVFWIHLGIVFGLLRIVSGVQGGLGVIVNHFRRGKQK